MRILIVVMLALVLSGCPFGGVNQVNTVQQSERLREPELFNRPGMLSHAATGFAFAEWYDNFERVNAYRYDRAGLSASFGYNDRTADGLIVATVYIYPAPRMTFVGASPRTVASLQQGWLSEEFAASKAQIEVAHPGLQERPSRPFVAPEGDSVIQGPSFSYVDSDLLSELHLLIYDRQWFVRCRFTYPEAYEVQARARIDALAPQLPWVATQPATSE